MKHLILLSALCFFAPFGAICQTANVVQDLEGLWYRDGRTAVCYTLWYSDGEPGTLRNSTYSIICGDTIRLGSAVIRYNEQQANMSLQTDSIGETTRSYHLVRADDDVLIWENDQPGGLPRQIEWRFYGNNYCAFVADGAETGFRHKRMQPIRWRFRALAGINRSNFSEGQHTFQLGFSSDSEFTQMTGQDLSVSAGIIFPGTRLILNIEGGITRRQVGVSGSIFSQEVLYTREGVYDFVNTYLALMPELSLGARKNLSVSGGFYFGLAQMRSFRGTTYTSGSGIPDPQYLDPSLDVTREHGLLAGISYRLPILRQLEPAVYARYTRGLIGTQVRAATIGLSCRISGK